MAGGMMSPPEYSRSKPEPTHLEELRAEAEGERHTTLLEALAAASAEMPTVKKDSSGNFKNRYVSLDALTDATKPVLLRHGLLWLTFPGSRDGSPTLEYRLTHVDSGDSLMGEIPLLLPKPDPQGQGSAITYCRRYALQAVLNLVAEEDDDGNAASQKVELVTAEDIKSLREAAKGLTSSQIGLVFGSLGLPCSQPFMADDLAKVPKNKAAELARKLASVER